MLTRPPAPRNRPFRSRAQLVSKQTFSPKFSGADIAAWKAQPRVTRGGQLRYSALSIATTRTLLAPFRLALLQTEGLIGSNIALLGLCLLARLGTRRSSS
ncbi:MAG: transposase [Pseudomonadota bacterium]|nr:transposase [Pseudomonadota bacterium]